MPEPFTVGVLVLGYYASRGIVVPDGEPTTANSPPGAYEVSPVSGRGRVLGLTAQQRRNRALYLAGELPIEALDEHVRKSGAPRMCPDLYYRLKDFNGGKDPTAPDPATRWKAPGGTTEFRTCDCTGGASWIGGFDRKQPARMSHLGGDCYTDSILADAIGAQRCFAAIDRAEVGCYLVWGNGTETGHILTAVDLPPPEIEYGSSAWWRALGLVDVASRTGRANKRTTGASWGSKDTRFVIPIMKP